jgi:PAS domain S-box-containing protein
MSRPRPAELLTSLAELTRDLPSDRPPREIGDHLLAGGVAAIGASGGVAWVKDSRGDSVHVVVGGAAPAAEQMARDGEHAWLSVGERTVASAPLEIGGRRAGGVAVWFEEERDSTEGERAFLEALGHILAREVDRASLLQKLTRSEEQLRVALEAGQLGAWDWDIAAEKVVWSTTLEAIHGLEAGSFAGTFEAYQRDIHPEDRARVMATIARAVEERTHYHVLYRINRPDGALRWLEAHGRLFCDASGTPRRLIGVCMDITERRRAEEQQHDMLLALRDADRRKDQFLAMLAHELRNPLGPMLNAAHLLGRPNLGEGVAVRAREILERQVRHMARLLDDLLDVSRITRGKIELDRERLDLSALAREVIGDHMDSFRAAGLSLEIGAAPEPIVVHADRTRLAQVIGNLLSNALKFSERGQSVRVRVDLPKVGQPAAVLTVRDEGAGIEPDLLGRIFDPFVQADTSLSRPRGGLGLGLAVVQGLVALHGGRVEASSGGSGKGTEVRIEIPLCALDAEVVEAQEPAAAATGTAATVLLFEDNADAAESLRVVLSDAGYRVWVEPTGRRAREILQRVRPDVVLCDLGLPDCDGYSVAADIRSEDGATSRPGRLPLIALSGYGAAEDQERSRLAGFDLHLTKPVAPARLLSELASRIVR